jgi:hypothetical protein
VPLDTSDVLCSLFSSCLHVSSLGILLHNLDRSSVSLLIFGFEMLFFVHLVAFVQVHVAYIEL